MTADATLKPPIARRDESLVLYAGAAPPDWPEGVPRQAEGSTEKLVDPPVAIPNPYGWLRDDKRENKEVIAHLEAENAYSKGMTAHLEGLRQTLYDDLLASIQETDFQVPRPHGEYYRYSRTFQGKSYTTYCRAKRDQQEYDEHGCLKISWDGKAETPILPGEEIVLDVNELAAGKEYCVVGGLAVSPSKKLLAYAVDFSGNEKYKLVIIDLATREVLYEDLELEISGNICWGKDDSSLFYMTMDETRRPYQLWRKRFDPNNSKQVLGDKDEMIQQEDDPQFWSGVGKTLDDKYVFLEHGSGETTEVWFIDLDEDKEINSTTTTKLECIAKRRYKVLYDVDYRDGYFYITSKTGNETPNMQLFTAPAKANCEKEWTLLPDPSSNDDKPLFDGGYDRVLEGISTFKTHVVAHGREGGIPRVWILSMEDNGAAPKVTKFEALTFGEEAYDVGLSSHYEYDAKTICVAYDSLITPLQHVEISLEDLSQRTVVKQKNVPGYVKDEFDCERYMVKSRDGKVEIPVLKVYRKDVMEQHLKDGKPVPTHLYGYGSYGSCIEADFRSTRLPLLRRGMVYVIAQIRGGGELGRQWYEEPNGGKYLCKKNTFNDFVDVARDLIETKKMTTPDMLSTEGRSAGGMLMGATVNQVRPESAILLELLKIPGIILAV